MNTRLETSFDSKRQLSVSVWCFQVMDVPELTSGSSHYLSSGLVYTSTGLWVGQLKLDINRGGSIAPVSIFCLIRSSTSSQLFGGRGNASISKWSKRSYRLTFSYKGRRVEHWHKRWLFFVVVNSINSLDCEGLLYGQSCFRSLQKKKKSRRRKFRIIRIINAI